MRRPLPGTVRKKSLSRLKLGRASSGKPSANSPGSGSVSCGPKSDSWKIARTRRSTSSERTMRRHLRFSKKKL